jgi:hypothetical protein
MHHYNSFNELTVDQRAKDNPISSNTLFSNEQIAKANNVYTENVPHISFDGRRIDFRMERYDQDDKKAEGEPLDAPPITSAADRKRFYDSLGGQRKSFHGTVPAGNHALSAYAGKVLYFVPNKENPQAGKVEVGDASNVGQDSVALPNGWHTKAYVD